MSFIIHKKHKILITFRFWVVVDFFLEMPICILRGNRRSSMDALTASYFLLSLLCCFIACPAKNTASAEAVKYGSFKPEALRSAVKKGMIIVWNVPLGSTRFEHQNVVNLAPSLSASFCHKKCWQIMPSWKTILSGIEDVKIHVLVSSTKMTWIHRFGMQ